MPAPGVKSSDIGHDRIDRSNVGRDHGTPRSNPDWAKRQQPVAAIINGQVLNGWNEDLSSKAATIQPDNLNRPLGLAPYVWRIGTAI